MMTTPKFNSLTKVQEFRVKLYPKNYQASVLFYRNVLLFPVIKEWDRAADQGTMFDTGLAIIELLHEGNPQPVNGCDLSLEVADVWKLFKDLKQKAKIVFPLRDNEWGDSSFCVADPSGFEITFFTKTE